MRRWLAIAAIMFFLPACATWEGRSRSDLIAHFGLPSKTLESKEGEYFQYNKCDSGSVIVPTGGTLIDMGGSCSRKMFLIKDDVVVKQFPTKYN